MGAIAVQAMNLVDLEGDMPRFLAGDDEAGEDCDPLGAAR